jgi:hypothetical protein
MKGTTIHLLLDNVSPRGGQPFQQEMVKDAEAWIARANGGGGSFRLEVLESRGDRAKQKAQVEELGRQLPPDSEDFVGISPTATGFVDFQLQSLFSGDAGTTRDKLTVCIFLEPPSSRALQQYKECRLICATPSQEVMGRMQGEVVHRAHPTPGNVLYMSGPLRSYQTKARLRGAREYLEPKGYSILPTIESDWEGSSAEESVADWSGRIEKVIAAIAQNDSMAKGLKAGLLRRGGDHIPVVGLDGTAPGRALVDSGKLVATIVQPNGVAGALETYSRMLDGSLGLSDLPADRDIRAEPSCYPALDKVRPVSGQAE